MNSYRCPRCGQPIPAWQPIHIRCLAFRLRYVILGISAFILLVFMIPQLIRDRAIVGSAKDQKTETEIVAVINTSDSPTDIPKPTIILSIVPSNMPSKTPTIKPTNMPASTPTIKPTRRAITATIIPSKTPSATISSCPGAPPQRISVDQRAWVCTKRDRLIVRSEPNRSGGEITRLEPGTFFKVINGPVCADNWSWWGIKTDTGLKG